MTHAALPLSGPHAPNSEAHTPSAPVRRQEPAETEERVEEYLAGWQRARADYENLAKRVAAEVADARDAGADALVRSLLPVVDHFEEAARRVPPALARDPWVAGILHSVRSLRDALERAGVTRIEDTRVPFDPRSHEAVGEQPSTGDPGMVAEIVAAGYARGSRVLRAAKVLVSKKTS